jgi:hypothetical protein
LEAAAAVNATKRKGPPAKKRIKPSAEARALLARKPELSISREEWDLLRKVNHDSFALYMQLAWACDERTGIVHGATYDSLRKNLLNADLVPVGRANVRICLLELDDAGLIVFDRSTPTKTSPELGIRTPHQMEAGEA